MRLVLLCNTKDSKSMRAVKLCTNEILQMQVDLYNGHKMCGWWLVGFAMQHNSPLLLHLFNGLFSGITCVSHYQKVKTSLNLNKARGDGVSGCSGWTTCIMQTICTSLQADNQHLIIQFLQAGCSS